MIVLRRRARHHGRSRRQRVSRSTLDDAEHTTEEDYTERHHGTGGKQQHGY
jgi:hypothetical protein